MEALRSGRAVTGSGHREEARYPWNLGYASLQRVRPVLRSYEEESSDTRYKTATVPIRSPRVYDNDSDHVGSSRSRLPSMSRHCDRILSKKREKTQSIEVKVVVRAVGTPHLCSSVREEGRRDGRSRCCCIWRTEKEGKMAAGISALSTTDSVVNNVSPWRRSRRLESWQTVRSGTYKDQPRSPRDSTNERRAFWRIHPVHTRISYLLTIGTSIAGDGREDEKEEEEEKEEDEEEEVEKEEAQCEFTFRDLRRIKAETKGKPKTMLRQTTQNTIPSRLDNAVIVEGEPRLLLECSESDDSLGP
ncbi:hypothetical protein V1477_012846 [Vespula maculifrons]|uniref:Uncharacterized protein n=1 Tax=Vespula maculifrons TaxID=7453 RepID=A0ABD2BU89_VESMC